MATEAKSARSRATIRDVAARAEVSKSLVSLVYSSPDSVSPERRERVRRAAAELGYRPNHVARSLNGMRDDIVGILVADSRNPVLTEIVDAARATLFETGRLGVVFSAITAERGSARLDVELLSMIADLRPASLLIVGSVPEMHLIRQAMPAARIVVASAIPAQLEDAPSVHGDDAAGVGLAVGHLVAQHHRRIAHIGGIGGPTAEVRATAFESALAAHKLAPERIGLSDFTERSGYRAAMELLEAPHPPSALVAASDLAAIGALAAVRDRGLVGRVAVTGYDNTYLAELGLIALTSVDPGNREIGRRGALLLTADDDGIVDTHLIEPQIAIRSSSDFFAPGD
ncbi:LacI family transcriptional regulator [Microbacterium protaetiae]|uniref:LacI family transcriptional regulator n=1 Tax=Microbacterium protaetiae TaxID=2509458 RepID=A0A4P6EP06_9MICO|nr:LacI family DNA-binding transcriptional regulator [Microbacterium protaetiae]QAY59658.1 LacI family transcriptional regulator [Microbacterium protaetiae]